MNLSSVLTCTTPAHISATNHNALGISIFSYQRYVNMQQMLVSATVHTYRIILLQMC